MVSDGSIFLTNMQSDIYRLEVQASSGKSDWTPGLAIDIEVLAKWWETWTFRFAVGLAIILLGFVGYNLRINAIRRRQKYLELINVHQQKLIDSEIETQERERKRIATDLHDGVGASLSGIKMQVTDSSVNDNLNDVIAEIKRIVYDLHPPSLERYGLRAALKSLAERIDKNTDVDVIFDYYGQREVGSKVSISVYRIIQELINNTLKHAQASEIRIHINEFEKEMNVMYEDNGIGMVGSRFTGLGLHSIESRVRSMNGRMTWESNHKGTFYNFDIPF
jgi:signal transduction histidine kinase